MTESGKIFSLHVYKSCNLKPRIFARNETRMQNTCSLKVPLISKICTEYYLDPKLQASISVDDQLD